MNKLSRNTSILLISNVGSAILAFLLSVLIGRALGQEGLGIYAAALAWVFPLSLIAEFGFGTLITRDVAQNEALIPVYIQQSARIRLFIGGGLMLILIVFAPFLSHDAHVVSGLQIFAPLILILPSFGAFTAVFRAQQRMIPIAGLNIGMLAIQVGLTAWILTRGGNIQVAMLVNTLTSAGQLGAARWVYRLKSSEQAQHSAFLEARFSGKSLLRSAWPFAVAGVLAAAQTRMGILLLEQLTNTAEVGYYAAVMRFVEAGRMIPNALFGALFPMLAAMVAHPAAIQRLFWRVQLGLSSYGLVFAIVFSLGAGVILRLTYGNAFSPAENVLVLGAWSLMPSLLRAGQTLYWYANGREAFVNIVTVGMLILQALLSLWLIPLYGALGAAIVSILVEIVAFMFLLIGGLPRVRSHASATN